MSSFVGKTGQIGQTAPSPPSAVPIPEVVPPHTASAPDNISETNTCETNDVGAAQQDYTSVTSAHQKNELQIPSGHVRHMSC